MRAGAWRGPSLLSARRVCVPAAAAPTRTQHSARRWERCTNSRGAEVVRPVVRLDMGGRPVIITRVDPAVRSTSLLIR
jgi:hypothetical protein